MAHEICCHAANDVQRALPMFGDCEFEKIEWASIFRDATMTQFLGAFGEWRPPGEAMNTA